MGRITSFSKQVIVFFLVTALIIRPTFAANVGGWTLGNPIAQGASAIINGTKTVVINGVNVVKNSTAKITPPSGDIAKLIARGAAGYALSIAVEQLLGSVDWVLDPANNRIKYYDNKANAITGKNYYERGGKKTYISGDPTTALCQQIFNSQGIRYVSKKVGNGIGYCQYIGDTGAELWFYANPAYDPSQREEKYLPIPTLADKIISNAAANDSSAQQVIVAAAQDIINEAETDNTKARPIVNQLETNAATPTDQTSTGKAEPTADPATGEQAPPTDISLEFPKFCSWAPTVCEAAQLFLVFPNTLADWWQSANTKADEWALSISQAWSKVKEEYNEQPQENTDTELEIPDLEEDIEVDTDISFGGSCPSPLSSDINFMGINKTIQFSFDPVCQIAEFIKPVVISISAFSAALIVAGIRTEDD